MSSKVSIIVPVYNVSNYIEKCLSSLVQQSEEAIEIIIIDDGSTDGSDKIVDEYANKDDRILVKHNNNQGVSVSRNEGISLASSEWIMFVDADDWISPNAVETLLSFESSDSDIIDGEYVSVRNESSNLEVKCCKKNGSIISNKNLMYGSCIVNPKTHKRIYKKIVGQEVPSLTFVWGKLYRRDFIMSYGINFDSNLKRGEDQKFNIICAHDINSILKTKEVIYFYRTRTDSASRKWLNAIPEYKSYADEIKKELSRGAENVLMLADLWNLKKFEIIMKVFSGASMEKFQSLIYLRNKLNEFINDQNYAESIDERNPLLSHNQKIIQWFLRNKWIILTILLFKIRNINGVRGSNGRNYI